MRRRTAATITLGILLTGTGCTHAITGTPSRESGPAPASPWLSAPAAPAPSTPSAAPPSAGPLVADVLPDECLLDAAQFGTLLGEPVLSPVQTSVPGGDQPARSSCFADAADGAGTPVGSVNVYGSSGATPHELVRAEDGRPGHRDLPGVGDAATLIGTGGGGVTMHLAAGRFLVTISALRRSPSDSAWAVAAAAAVARLPH